MSLQVEVMRGDITDSNTAAIVNAANNELWMGSGVAGAIKARGGQVIEDEAVARGPLFPGAAVQTTAGKLPFSYVIHGAVMGQDLRTTAKLIRQTTLACLNLAEKLHLESLTFPAFGTGVGRFPVPACARLMVTTICGYEAVAKYLKRVEFCLFDDVAFGLFREALAEAKRARGM